MSPDSFHSLPRYMDTLARPFTSTASITFPKVVVVRGGQRKRRVSEWGFFFKKEQVPRLKKERNWLWIRVLDSSEMQEN